MKEKVKVMVKILVVELTRTRSYKLKKSNLLLRKKFMAKQISGFIKSLKVVSQSISTLGVLGSKGLNIMSSANNLMNPDQVEKFTCDYHIIVINL